MHGTLAVEASSDYSLKRWRAINDQRIGKRSNSNRVTKYEEQLEQVSTRAKGWPSVLGLGPCLERGRRDGETAAGVAAQVLHVRGQAAEGEHGAPARVRCVLHHAAGGKAGGIPLRAHCRQRPEPARPAGTRQHN